ncbi:MAG: hypothetical protein HYY17_14725 [Planctomycetes bacterium]|nr:hypothetical protein [Planctomycetota bacterium]
MRISWLVVGSIFLGTAAWAEAQDPTTTTFHRSDGPHAGTHGGHYCQWWKESTFTITAVRVEDAGEVFWEKGRAWCDRHCEPNADLPPDHACGPGVCFTDADSDYELVIEEEEITRIANEASEKIASTVTTGVKIPEGLSAQVSSTISQSMTKKVETETRKLVGQKETVHPPHPTFNCAKQANAGGVTVTYSIDGTASIVVESWYYVTDPQHLSGWWCGGTRTTADSGSTTEATFTGSASAQAVMDSRKKDAERNCACRGHKDDPVKTGEGDKKQGRLDPPKNEDYMVATVVTVKSGNYEPVGNDMPAGTTVNVRRDERTNVTVPSVIAGAAGIGKLVYGFTALTDRRGFNDATPLGSVVGKQVYPTQPLAFTGTGGKDSFLYAEADGKAIEIDPVLRNTETGEIVYANPRTPDAIANAKEIKVDQMTRDLRTTATSRMANGRLLLEAQPKDIGPGQSAVVIGRIQNPDAIDPGRTYAVKLVVKGAGMTFGSSGTPTVSRIMTGAELKAGIKDTANASAASEGACEIAGSYSEVVQ